MYKTAVPETVATLRPRFPLDVIVNFKLSIVKKVPGLIRPLVTEIPPVAPVAPTAPVAPFCPVAPVAQVVPAPVTPVSPVAPVKPCGPMLPPTASTHAPS